MNPHMEEELKKNKRIEMLKVPQEELLRVNLNLFKCYRVSVCTRTSFSALLAI
jgi:hypothetical protein